MSEPKPNRFGPVQTWPEIESMVQEISKQNPQSLILFRGQRRLHENIRSGRARPDARVHKDVEAGWRSLARQMLGLAKEQNGEAYAKAILQHYGMATHFVDLTKSIEVAAWFAMRNYSRSIMIYGGGALRQYEHVLYEPSHEGCGYILVLAIPRREELLKTGRLFDLSSLPSDCVRPHRQKGWLMLDRPPTEPTPNSFWAATIEVDCRALPIRFTTTDLFPEPSIDPAFATLLSLPFVQVPSAYFGPNDSNEKHKEATSDEGFQREMDEMCFASRALSIPEYGNDAYHQCTDHTWADLTIYEPHHMRMWKWWRFELGSVHPGATGDIKDTAKITLSPEAKEILFGVEGRKCSWPDLDSDGLFFTFAALDHDKVIDHGPPYDGVWLQRDDELIIETPMVADNDALSVTAGHSYFLRNGELERQLMKTACRCGKPETHDKRVRSVLQLSSFLKDGALILLPHPRLADLGWYVVIAGSEGQSMQPRIASFKRVVKALSENRAK
jgi:hypothetical protein